MCLFAHIAVDVLAHSFFRLVNDVPTAFEADGRTVRVGPKAWLCRVFSRKAHNGPQPSKFDRFQVEPVPDGQNTDEHRETQAMTSATFV